MMMDEGSEGGAAPGEGWPGDALASADEPVLFLEATVLTAGADVEYSFVVRAVGGIMMCPMVPIGFIGKE